MTDDNLKGIERVGDIYRVHGASKKEKKEERKKSDQDFRELFEEGAKEVKPFQQETTVEEEKQEPSTTLLNRLSASSAPPIISEGTNANGKQESKK